MPSQTFRSFRHNLVDVERLLQAHDELSPNHSGRRALGHITRSGVVMLCAAWELYTENVLIECAKYLSSNYHRPTELPLSAQKHLSKLVKEAKNELKPLELGGIGWKQLYVAYCSNEAKSINTPKTTILEPLYKRFIGLDSLSDFWTVDGQYITDFVSVRGGIAHNGRSADYIHNWKLQEYYETIKKSAFSMDNKLCEYCYDLVESTVQPWRKMSEC